MLTDLSQTVVVFDLDDTIYPEADYVESGVRYVSHQISKLYGENFYSELRSRLLENPKIDWLDAVCELCGITPLSKESLLWMYRLHMPDIALSRSCELALKKIKSNAKSVAIVTDGRSVTQRLKLIALGLDGWPAYISEDYGSLKPCPKRFKAIETDYPSKHYVYVADNPQKDFLGCKPLGWIGIGMRSTLRNIHPQAPQKLSPESLPHYWVANWEDLIDLLGA
jgi:putative hydrolase of the HAD superfamily